jgi:hypothetical protein
MTNIVERLRKQDCQTMLDAYDVMDAAADEIERLKAELEAETQRRWDGNRIASDEAAADFNEMRDMAVKEMARWAREAGASQAREAKLRELLTQFELWESYDDPETPIKDALARIGSDDTALQEAIKQAKREALLEAAEWFNEGDPAWSRLKEMAEEIK